MKDITDAVVKKRQRADRRPSPCRSSRRPLVDKMKGGVVFAGAAEEVEATAPHGGNGPSCDMLTEPCLFAWIGFRPSLIVRGHHMTVTECRHSIHECSR